MTIKDVEKATGLTTKSIRYYEEKGLINIKRNDNDYRNYTELDIERLKLIKILRYINFSIEDIYMIFKNDSLNDSLKEKSRDLENDSNTCLEKQSICNSLLKDSKKKEFKKIIDDYSAIIKFLEGEDAEKFKFNLIESICPNFSYVIIQSLIFISPIIWLFINIYNKKWDAMLINSVAAILCTGLLVYEWSYYFNYLKKHKENTKNKNKKNSLVIPVMIISIISVIILFVLLNIGLEKLLAPKDYLFFETHIIVSKMMIFLIVIFFIIIVSFLLKKLKINRTESLDIYLELWDKFKYILLAIFIIITYCFFTSSTFVTRDKIIYRSPIHPFGIYYNYNDVTKIITGFGNKNFSLFDYKKKGAFYYTIYIDNKKITFSVPSTNSNIKSYEDDPYLELEEFNNQLKKYNIPKITDDKYSHLCDLDKQFCDRFVRIINNK